MTEQHCSGVDQASSAELKSIEMLKTRKDHPALCGQMGHENMTAKPIV